MTKHEFLPCVPGALHGGLRRTEFYDGMVLGEDDMKREQSYWQMKRRLTNRALGSGVVWGLSLQWDAKTRAFTICPGFTTTGMVEDYVASRGGPSLLSDIPLGRPARRRRASARSRQSRRWSPAGRAECRKGGMGRRGWRHNPRPCRWW